jgi:LysM repeat protein
VAAIVFPTLPVQARATTGPTQSCGPFAGWIRGYTVQAGDTLFGIATRYHTTVPQLQRANCRISTAIFSGETLWVPNVPMVTPGITTIPTFDTPTDWPTETGTAGEPSLTAAPPPPTVTVDP